MVMYANCHLHSTFSDGAFTPEKLIEMGKELGHQAMVLTDHDTIRGTYFMHRAARRAGVKSILGCEFSTRGPEGCEIHLLGFDFNRDHRDMAALLEVSASRSATIARYLLEKGIERGTVREGVVWNDVIKEYPYHDYISNGHIFDIYRRRGIYKPEEYGEYFVSTFKKTPERMAEIEASSDKLVLPKTETVVKTILAAGGVPVAAHLGEAPFGKIEYAEELREMGVRGFEVCHPGNNEYARKYLVDFCNEYGLYKTGGTDHSAELGGCKNIFEAHNLPDDCGGMSEEDFMTLYERRLG